MRASHLTVLLQIFTAALLAGAALAERAHAAGASAGSVRMALATPGGVRFTVAIPEPRFARTDAEQRVDRLELDGFESDGAPGTPSLPTRTMLVAVPPVGEVRLTAVASELRLSEDVTLAANPGLDRSGERTDFTRSLSAYSAGGSAQPVAARLIEVTWMRNQRVARVVIEPAAYQPALRRLTLAGRVDVELAVASIGALGPDAEPNDPFEPIYRAALANYEQGRSWRRPRTGALLAAAKRTGMPLAATAALIAPPDTSVYAGRTWIKIAIQKSGFYSVNFSRLRGLSLFSATVPAPMDSLRLFTWPGVTVLPEASYCDSCDYREVALGIALDVVPPGSPPNVLTDGLFSENDDAIYFFAQGPDGWESEMDASRPDTNYVTHPYDRNNYYYLTLATAERPVSGDRYPVAPRRIGVTPASTRNVTPDGSETAQATVAGRVHVERDVEYWPDAAPVRATLVWEKWFWRSLAIGQTFTDTLDLADADSTLPARFRLRQWGLSRVLSSDNCRSPGFDHQLDVGFNTVEFPRAIWTGICTFLEQGVQMFDTTGTFLRQTDNVMRVAVPFYTVPLCPGFSDRSGLAWYEVYYERHLRPQGDAIDFRTHPGSGRFRYDIGPFQSLASSSVFDVTEPLSPVLLQGGVWSGVPGAFTLSIADTQSVPHRYMVVPDSILNDNRARILASALSDAPFTSLENLRSATQAADYLLIYYDGFKVAADSLVAWRREHLPLMAGPAPYVARAVPVSALFDQFSGGRIDPGAIRNFLRAALGWSRRPLYITFLGDASFDFKNITGRAVSGQPASLLPTYENGFDRGSQILRQFASDDWLVNVNDPVVVVPDYLSGRIPAGDATSALGVITGKILGYERSAPFGEYRNRAIFMADDDRQSAICDGIGWGHLAQTNDLNVQDTPAHIDRDYVYLHTFPYGPGSTKPGARSRLIQDLNAGTSLFNFVGHGSPFKMTDEGVFLDSDAGTLTNGLRLGVLVAASCDVGKFNDPTVPSLGESMFMSSSGGSIAVVSATELALSGPNSALNGRIYDHLFTRDTLTVAGVHLAANGQYQMPVSAALLAAKLAQGTSNDQKFQLMGDPGTRLNLPRLWSEVALTDAAGAPVTQFARGQTVFFRGQVLDRPGGSPVALDGVSTVLIEDSTPINSTVGSGDPDCKAAASFPESYVFSAGPMYHGDVTVSAGVFNGRFVVPLDATAGPRGRIRSYVDGRPGAGLGETDGVGSLAVSVVSGTAPTGDDEGPRITLSFVGGSVNVRGDATLQINLFDQNGIMTTGHAPLNSIIVTVDDNTTSRTSVTESFRYAADSYQSGTATFRLPDLAAGPHQVKVSAADNLATGFDAVRHRSSATLDFQVGTTPPLHVARTFLFPNPIRSGGKGSGGVFVVDAPGDSVNTLLRVYTVAGKLVRVLRQMGGIGQVQVNWDGLDEEGEPLAQGTYLYKVYVSAREADGTSSPRQKATAQGRIVVLSP